MRHTDALQAGSSLRELPAIPAQVMNGIHAYAYEFYQQGRLDEAEAFFRFLCLYDFYNADYAMGLAAVFQLQGRHRQAIDLYGVAMRLGFTDPTPVFHAGQCFLKLGEIEDARECFAYVLAETDDGVLRERADAYLVSIGGPPQRDDMMPAGPFQSDVIGDRDE
ncbi:Chaperone protein IpgC [Pararobbsia alpina]